jgi:pimeloyl-ACP methyl ester carboxylesterase
MMQPVDKRIGARFAAVAASVLMLTLVSGCALQRQQEALLVLGDIAAGSGESRLKKKSAQPTRTPVAYTIDGRPHAGDLYLPGNGAPDAAIVLVPGAVPEGKDDARLVELAITLARARFAVLTPDLPGYRKLKVRPDDAREVADAVRYLAGRKDLAPDGRIGIGAFSYAVGPAVIASLEDDIREQVRFILGIGGYHDLRKSIRFFTTGYYEHRGKLRHMEASGYGKLVFARSVMDHLRDPDDRAIIDAMVETKLADHDADISVFAQGLGPEGMTVYRLLMNTDPDRTFDLIAELPAQSQQTIAALTLHDKDLARLKARLILIHGRNDPLIPFPESRALGKAVAPSQARVFIINRILGHVDLALSDFISWSFWTQEVPDAWRLFRATSVLLKQRESPRRTRSSGSTPPAAAEAQRGLPIVMQDAARSAPSEPFAPVRGNVAPVNIDYEYVRAG